jgi:Protein of unknown function (DUF2721)
MSLDIQHRGSRATFCTTLSLAAGAAKINYRHDRPRIVSGLRRPAIFISGAGLLVLSINTGLLGIVSRLRAYHREKHTAIESGNVMDRKVLPSQIEFIEQHAGKIRNTFVFALIGIMGVMVTCLVLGLSTRVPDALVVAVMLFVLSVLSMLIGMMFFYLPEVVMGLSSVQEEEKLYSLLDSVPVVSKDS